MKEPKIIVLRSNRIPFAFWPENGPDGGILVFSGKLQALVHATGLAKYDKEAKFFVATLEEL